eukprot:GHVP01056254.1.p1 GENE.GHVP01056254.1~~GHVP01056254.1.p1  ORF type:complete len:133 (+),score=13.62 GHVP01056254.1:65-463(+)
MTISDVSMLEATRRCKQAMSNVHKIEGYKLWIRTMIKLDKITEADPQHLRYHCPTVIVRKPNESIRVTYEISGLKLILHYSDSAKIRLKGFEAGRPKGTFLLKGFYKSLSCGSARIGRSKLLWVYRTTPKTL